MRVQIDSADWTPYPAGGLAILAALAVQAALVGWTFPASELLSGVPLFHIDAAFHWYEIEVAKALAAQGQSVGYDPRFAAGHVAGLILDSSARAQALVAVVLAGHVSTIVAYKLSVFALAAIGPAMVPAGAIAFRLERPQIWLAAPFALCLWWASGFRWYHTAGMASFVFAAFSSLPFTALLLQLALRPSTPLQVVSVGLLGAVGFFIHPLFPVLIALALIGFLAMYVREIRWTSALAKLLCVAAISLALNLFWLQEVVHHTLDLIGTQPYQRAVSLAAPFKELAGIWATGSMGAKIFIGLMAPTVYAAVLAATPHTRRFARACLLAWLLLTLFAHLGGAVPVAGALQPNRFSAAAYLFLIPSCAVAVGGLIRSIRSATGITRLVPIGVAAVFVASLAWSIREVAGEMSYAPTGHYGAVPPEVRPVGAKSAWLVDWLRRNTTAQGRILFETSVGRVYDNANNPGYLAASSDRAFIGGPYPFMFKASAWDGHAFDQPIDSMTIDQFEAYLDAYNIGWIVAHSDEMQRYLRAVPNIEPEERFEGIQTFRVRHELTYFFRGSGIVEKQAINAVELSHLSGLEVAIKFHYVAGLETDPPARLEPYNVAGVDQPFIRLVAPPEGRLRLYLRR